MENLLVGLTGVIILGIGAQWLSWRLRAPAIPLLLIAGLVAGPVTGFIKGDLLGDLLFPVVSLSVAIILFEGGLSLNIAELRGIGRVVRNLISIGALVTWAASAALALLFLGFDAPLAVLLGAVLVVTGPTVIVPLLRHVHPTARLRSTIKWEGIVNDPIGAILAVLVFEAIVSGGVDRGAPLAIVGVLKAVVIGGVLGLIGAGVMVLLLKKYWLPDFLQSPVTLAVVISVFTASNSVQTESGLLAVTVMGAALASQNVVSLRHIVAFKENLRVLLISALFIILAARLQAVDFPVFTNLGSLLFVGALILLVRPAAVALATWRSVLTWRERVFLGCMAPRGIVAAAVASIFGLRLHDMGYPGAEQLAPVTFLVIVGTVALYSFAAAPVARWLEVASPNPQGVLVVGATPWVRAIAKALGDQDIKVMLVDSNWTNVTAARKEGLEAQFANILSERMSDEVELDGIGRLLALTSNDEVNALAAVHYDEVFDRSHLFQLPADEPGRGERQASMPQHLRGRPLFAPDATYSKIEARYRAGAVVKRTTLTDEFDYDAFRIHYGNAALPLFAVKESGGLEVFTADKSPSPKAGVTLVSLVDPVQEEAKDNSKGA